MIHFTLKYTGNNNSYQPFQMIKYTLKFNLKQKDSELNAKFFFLLWFLPLHVLGHINYGPCNYGGAWSCLFKELKPQKCPSL